MKSFLLITAFLTVVSCSQGVQDKNSHTKTITSKDGTESIELIKTYENEDLFSFMYCKKELDEYKVIQKSCETIGEVITEDDEILHTGQFNKHDLTSIAIMLNDIENLNRNSGDTNVFYHGPGVSGVGTIFSLILATMPLPKKYKSLFVNISTITSTLASVGIIGWGVKQMWIDTEDARLVKQKINARVKLNMEPDISFIRRFRIKGIAHQVNDILIHYQESKKENPYFVPIPLYE